VKPRYLPKSNVLSEIDEHLTEKYFHSVFKAFSKLN
jgi:hypothetical protein